MLENHLKGFPRFSQVRCKHCQIHQRKINYMYFRPAKMVYLNDSQFKIWNEPMMCEQFIVTHSTIWSRLNTKPNFMPNLKRFQFTHSCINFIGLVYKPFSANTLEEYVLKYSQMTRNKQYDPLVFVIERSTKQRYKNIRLLDLEGRLTEGNLLYFLTNLNFYPRLESIKLESCESPLDMESVLNNQKLIGQKIFEHKKVVKNWESKEFNRIQKA